MWKHSYCSKTKHGSLINIEERLSAYRMILKRPSIQAAKSLIRHAVPWAASVGANLIHCAFLVGCLKIPEGRKFYCLKNPNFYWPETPRNLQNPRWMC